MFGAGILWDVCLKDEMHTDVVTRRQVPGGSASLGNGGGLFARMAESPHRDFLSRHQTASTTHYPTVVSLNLTQR